ncbi:hypothetical protein [Mucilaginibacter sp. KACC 22063]|uniref:hypothetical protein n=1 Tax=Mucilaginibacter sp. KACC 22063 TaxID=3025666 RepID=UPI002365520D|nr:hypothetical protein [Mucilaginibacter sp. KACC 22063]WDF53946.1 hypothetical protein PQ461_13440 [Mucilaginibacter sp. KACC 22063]
MINHLLIKIKEYDAHGGPQKKVHSKHDYTATPTDSGRFVIHTIEKHISKLRYFWFSAIPWGAGLRNINDVIYVDVNNNNHWVKLTSIVPQWINQKNHYTEKNVADELKRQWYSLNIPPDKSSAIMDNRELPDKWLFSDFGHISVKYFKDFNHDGIMNGKESVMNDFIHTTPDNEAVTSYNLRRTASQRPFPVTLPESHGCIHVKPTDIDIMIGAGYLKKGQGIVVHNYADKVIPATLKPDRYFRGNFEAHFFPGLFKIVIYKLI